MRYGRDHGDAVGGANGADVGHEKVRGEEEFGSGKDIASCGANG